MIIVFCGVSWTATVSVARFMQSVATATGHSAVVREASDLEAIGRAALARPEEVILLTVRWMTPALIEALTTAAVPIVFVRTSSSTLLGHWLEHRQGEPFAALREVFRDLAPAIELLRQREVLSFMPEMAGSKPEIAGFLRGFSSLAGGGDSFAAVAQEAGIAWPDPQGFAPLAEVSKPVLDVLSVLDTALESGRPGPIPVPLPMLMVAGFTPLAGPIDLTGSARILFFGPMIALPSGLWTVSVTLVCHGVSQRPKVEMDAVAITRNGPEVFGKCSFVLIPDGRMKISYSFVNPSPDKPLEFRMMMHQAVFDGTIEVESMVVAPSDDTGAPA